MRTDEMRPAFTLPPPILHTPWLKGVYDVAPNLRLLGDEKALEFNRLWPRIRANKALQRSGRVLRHDLASKLEKVAFRVLADRLLREWPQYFERDEGLLCRLTGETATDLDGLVMNLPCDLALVRRTDEHDWTAYLHVCAPSHWRPEEKIGLSFVATHAPIPHFERVARGAKGLVEAMVARGPWVRFVWGFETDEELDHHPDRVKGRDFAHRPFVVRVERQVLIPLPEDDAALFLIGTGFVDRRTVLEDSALWLPLKAALQGMSLAARDYKGVAEGYDALMAQFDQSIVT